MSGDKPTLLLLDAQHLIYLAKSGGIEHKPDDPKAKLIGRMALDSHLHSNFQTVLVDAVLFETTLKPAKLIAPQQGKPVKSLADAALIADWVAQNGIPVHKTEKGEALLATLTDTGLTAQEMRAKCRAEHADAGEQAIIQARAGMPADQPYFIVIDDRRNTSQWKNKPGVEPALKIGTPDYLNMVYDNGRGTLPADQYATIRDGLKLYVPTLPGLERMDWSVKAPAETAQPAVVHAPALTGTRI